MRVAAICDIHGNVPALEAVLLDIDRAQVDEIVVVGDLFPGPMPRETLTCLLGAERPLRFVYGDGDLAVLAQMTATEPSAVRYWGTSSGAPLPEPLRRPLAWTAEQLGVERGRLIESWPLTVRLQIDGLGTVLFCHATPRNETEIFTRLTLDDRLRPVFQGQDAAVVVCGHTHMQFDRLLDGVRIVNAGSVGMPFGEPGAHWVLLGPGVQLRHTAYDLVAAAERVRATSYPDADDFASGHILNPPAEETMLTLFAGHELKP